MKTNIKNLLLLPALIAVLNVIPAGRVTAQTFTTLHSFTRLVVIDNGNFTFSFTNHDGAFPSSVLLTNAAGTTLYGTAAGGGSGGRGTVFVVGIDGTGFTSLHSFTDYGRNGTNSDGANPGAGLIVAGNTLYGTASAGGSSGYGTVFALNTDGTGFTNLHSFAALNPDSSSVYTNSDGAEPGGLIWSGSTLYGTAARGGSDGAGTVFALNTEGPGFTNLHSFTAASTDSSGVYTNSDGSHPRARLILSGNTLYGTTSEGGSSGNGTVFAVATDGTEFTNLRSFTPLFAPSDPDPFFQGTNSDGANPYAGLILSGDTLYGMASYGGSSGKGAMFSLSFRPQLTITPSDTNVILSWPISYAGFSYAEYILQETANLGSPDAWVVSDAFPPAIVNGQVRLTARMIGPQRFYRFKKD